nr:hypothetical protein CFP56_67320 [Quercus suber]
MYERIEGSTTEHEMRGRRVISRAMRQEWKIASSTRQHEPRARCNCHYHILLNKSWTIFPVWTAGSRWLRRGDLSATLQGIIDQAPQSCRRTDGARALAAASNVLAHTVHSIGHDHHRGTVKAYQHRQSVYVHRHMSVWRWATGV